MADHAETIAGAVDRLGQSDESEVFKIKALDALGTPTPAGTNVVYYIVAGVIGVIGVIAVLGLTHWFGSGVDDKTLVPIVTAVVSGLLGLLAKSPTD